MARGAPAPARVSELWLAGARPFAAAEARIHSGSRRRQPRRRGGVSGGVTAATRSNDALARLVRHAGPYQWVMWECECGSRCTELVTVMLRDFDERRTRGELVTAPGHETAQAA